MGTIIGDGITFDDVLLVPQYSEVTPNMVDLSTHLTKKVIPSPIIVPIFFSFRMLYIVEN